MANGDARFGDESKGENREANRNSKPIAIPGAAAVPVIQRTVLPIAGFPTDTGKTSEPVNSERAEDTGDADQKAAPAEKLSPRTALLTRNISAVNVAALPRPAEIQRTDAPHTVKPAASGVPADVIAPRETVSTNPAVNVAALPRPAEILRTDGPHTVKPAASAAPADAIAPRETVSTNPAVNVAALPRPVEIQRTDAPNSVQPAAGGAPVSMAALPATAGANAGVEGRDSSGALAQATAGSSKNGSDTTPLRATLLTGEANAPVSSSPLAFAARLSAQPVSTPPQPQLQPAPQPAHMNPTPAGATKTDTVTAAQTAARAGDSAHAGADGNAGQQRKAEQPELSAQSAAYQRAETTRPDSSRAPQPAAEPRAAEPGAAEMDPPAAQSANHAQVRDVRMQLTGSENQRVDVRVLDRGGELRVSVRADDPSLVRSLQDNMADLSTRLDQAHFRPEIWAPRTEAVSRSDSSSTNGRTLSNGNESSGRDGQGRQQNGRQNQQPAWMDDFEETTAGRGSGGKR